MPNKSLQFKVYSPAPALEFIDNLPNAVRPSYLEELKSDGAGSFLLSVDDNRVTENADILNPYNVVKAVVNGEVRGAFFIRNKHETLVGKGENAERMYEFSGPGLKGWLKFARVYASQTLADNKKLSDYRYFNFSGSDTHSWYNPADWEDATVQSTVREETVWNPTTGAGNPWKTAPVGWPDAPSAKWIWDRNTRFAAGAPEGDVYFRKEFTSTEQKSYALFATADDSFEAFIDGVPILAIREKNAWTALWRGDIDLPAGDHVIAIKASNVSGPAGLLAVLFAYSDPKEEEAAVLVTQTGDSGWIVNGYPTQTPGYTPGEVIRILMEEALARVTGGQTSALQALTLDFTDAEDSNGEPWEVVLDWAFEIGIDYLAVMQALEDLAIEWEIDPVTMNMRVYNHRGSDRSVQDGTTSAVVLRPAFNVTQASEEREYDIQNVLLLEYGDQLLTEVVDPHATIPTYGRIESYMSADAEMSRDRALFVANKFLELNSFPIEGAGIGIIDRDGHTPWANFNVGDHVKGPTTGRGLTKRRVVGLAVTADEDSGEPDYEVTLDTLLQERSDKIEALLARLPSWQTMGQRVSAGGAGSGGGVGVGDYYDGGAGGDYNGGYYGGDIGDGNYGGGVGGFGGGLVYIQDDEPDAPVGSLWFDTDEWVT